MLGGCQAVASAVSASGRRYWAMLIGGSSRASTRRAGVTRVRVGHDAEFGRDMTVDPYR
jgi:hypothetical protein